MTNKKNTDHPKEIRTKDLNLCYFTKEAIQMANTDEKMSDFISPQAKTN